MVEHGREGRVEEVMLTLEVYNGDCVKLLLVLLEFTNIYLPLSHVH